MMPKIQITVQLGQEEHDVEAFPEMLVRDLCAAVINAYGAAPVSTTGQPSYQVTNQTSGQPVDPNVTLVQARVWTGARLILDITQPVSAAQPTRAVHNTPPVEPTAPAGSTPLKGWRTLDTAGSSGQAAQAPANNDNFNWKRLD